MNEQTLDKNVMKKKRRTLTIVFWSIVFCLLAATFFAWFFHFRHHKYTNDAYVQGNPVVITPIKEGFVTSVLTDDTFLVTSGQVIVQLDETDAILALNLANEQLANAVREVCATYHQAFTYQAELGIRKAEYILAQEDYMHRYNVVNEGGVSLEDFQTSIASLESSYYGYNMTKNLYQKEVALIQGTSIRDNPVVQAAAEEVAYAYVQLKRCKIQSPVEGIVAQRRAQVGMWVKKGEPLMSVIPMEQIWVNANYRETQMRHMRIGQKVRVTADMYGSSVVYNACIIGLPGGAGDAFSLLPPQNLSGNWIKIVQRLPVRLFIEKADLKAHPLRLGMTMKATVDVRDQSGLLLPIETDLAPQWQTDIYNTELVGSKTYVDEIVQNNLDPFLFMYAEMPYLAREIEELELWK